MFFRLQQRISKVDGPATRATRRATPAVPFGTVSDKLATGEGSAGYVVIATIGDVATVVSMGLSRAAQAALKSKNIDRALQLNKYAIRTAVADNLIAAGYDIHEIATSKDSRAMHAGDLLLRLAMLGLNARQAKQLKAQFSLKQQVLDETSELIDNSSKGVLNRMAAHARAQWDEFISEGFQNVASGLTDRKLIDHGSDMVSKLGPGTLLIEDLDDYIGAIRKHYKNPMHPQTEDWIRTYVQSTGGVISTRAGLPGAHAEVLAVNHVLNYMADQGVHISSRRLSQIMVATGTLSRGVGGAFHTCDNCRGILSRLMFVLTGRIHD